jgi:HPt (histidine-containing phosphotransfer) domain-containing protein
MNTEQKVLDPNLALERAGGNADLAQDLYQMLQKELPVYLEKIPALFNAEDIPTLTATVHKLHGSATYCGVPALRVSTEAFESGLKRGESDMYPQLMADLLRAIRQLMEQPTMEL